MLLMFNDDPNTEAEVEEGDSEDVELEEAWEEEEVLFTPDFELAEPQPDAPKDEGIVFTGTDKNGRLVSG